MFNVYMDMFMKRVDKRKVWNQRQNFSLISLIEKYDTG